MPTLLTDQAIDKRIEDAVAAILDSRGDSFLQQPKSNRFRNDSGEEIPAYACMKVLDSELSNDRYLISVTKPDDTGGPYLFNGPRPVEIDGLGQYNTGMVRALFDTGTPAVNEIWGPTTSWEIESYGSCALMIMGQIEDDLALGQHPSPVTQISIKFPDAGIPARAGNQYGSATCEVMTTNVDGEGIQQKSPANEVTVWNQVQTIVGANGDHLGKANAEIDFRWHAIVDDCTTGEV